MSANLHEGTIRAFKSAPADNTGYGIRLFFLSDYLQVVITTPTPEAAIRYTIDGSPVTSDSPIYSAPIPVTETTELRARAFREGWTTSAETAGIYTIE